MKFAVIIVIYLKFAKGIDDITELKVTYYENLIKSAISKAEHYTLPKDNSAHLQNLSEDIKDFGEFDFIIVGAGSSGSVVSTRLSEVESFKILLLEAGGWDDDLTAIPYLSSLLYQSERNWGYYTTPQKNGCYGWRERKCAYPRGKLVGGSGSINSLAYVRGNRGDYDNWAALGNPGWSFDDVLPYFKKLENFESEKIDIEFRGFAGPVNSVNNKGEDYFDKLSGQLTEIGFDIIDDYNAKQQIGAARSQFFVRLGKRVSGATAYVRPSITRHNFNVTVRAFVTRILINSSQKEAYGVEFIKDGQRFIAKARKEVILSAGAINTPQLLMLSGIGPSNELRKHRIPIIMDLPVGEQLRDHFMLTLSYKSNTTKDYVTLREAISDFLDGKGVLTRSENRFAFSFINTRNESSSIPNIEFAYDHSSPLNLSVPSQSNFTDENSKYKKQLGDTFNIDIFLLHPKSSGTLKLQSKNIRDYPLIDFNIFGDVEDMEIYYEAIKFINKIEETKLAKENNLRILKYPLCNHYCDDSKEYWFCFLKYLAQTEYHPSTTAKMAPKTDPFAVVDSKLRVYGIAGLRIVDCSIMPTPISGHNNAVALMIGEKAADLVKLDYVIQS
ncbi:hypothetical protein WA026_008662 [Henosepilachna vigintioctopunctata]|uniref:Glucose-methanol-choline oxidoreductase N-terminal domain-containing protein n=1 Tax=Henosepilachna vigintioctopunctata TaxID=420089 RepID=A0AAW1UHY3_9CUCU